MATTICDIKIVAEKSSGERIQSVETWMQAVLPRIEAQLEEIKSTGRETLMQAMKTNGRVSNHDLQIKIIIAVLLAVAGAVGWCVQTIISAELTHVLKSGQL